MIELGVTYRDKISGFQGVATGHVVYLTGCNQTLLTARGTPEKDPTEPRWFDDQRMEEVPGMGQVALDNSVGAGADKPAPVRW